MYRILFHIPLHYIGLPDIPVYAYGFMLMLGFLTAIMLATRLGRRDGIKSDDIYNIALAGVISGVIGARIFWVFFFWPQGRPYSLKGMVAVWNGGLVYYGGLLLATGVIAWYLHRRKLPIGKVADALAPGLALGLAWGRIGCFLNGCCYGAICDPNAWYAVIFPPHSLVAGHHAQLALIPFESASLPVYPAQLFSSFSGLVIAVTLYIFHRHRRFPGQVMLLFLILYGVARFCLEIVRDDTPAYFATGSFPGLTAGQLVAVITFIIASVFMVIFWRRARARQAAVAEGKNSGEDK